MARSSFRSRVMIYGLDGDFLVGRHEELHDAPAYEIGYTADTEYDEVAGGFTFEAEERHIYLRGIVEEDA